MCALKAKQRGVILHLETILKQFLHKIGLKLCQLVGKQLVFFVKAVKIQREILKTNKHVSRYSTQEPIYCQNH